MLTFGILLVGILSYGFVVYVNHGWQYIQAFGAIPAIIMIIMKDSIPESPKWLLNHDSSEASKQQVTSTLRYLRPSNHDVNDEIRTMIDEAKNDVQTEATWDEVFKCRQAVIIGVGLMFFQVSLTLPFEPPAYFLSLSLSPLSLPRLLLELTL